MGTSSAASVGFTGGQLFVGLSATIGLAALAFQEDLEIEYFAGGGSGIYIAGYSTAGWSQGFFWGVTTLPFQYFPDFRGSLYFTTAGSTLTLNWWKSLSVHT